MEECSLDFRGGGGFNYRQTFCFSGKEQGLIFSNSLNQMFRQSESIHF